MRFDNFVKNHKELSAGLVLEFIYKIVVHAPKYFDGKRVQVINIYYNGIVILRKPSTEEMGEELQEHIVERNK